MVAFATVTDLLKCWAESTKHKDGASVDYITLLIQSPIENDIELRSRLVNIRNAEWFTAKLQQFEIVIASAPTRHEA